MAGLQTDTYKLLDMRFAATAAASHYSPGASKQAIIKRGQITATNQTGSPVNLTGYRNGTTAADIWLPAFSIPASTIVVINPVEEFTLSGTDLLGFLAATGTAVLVIINGVELS